MELIVKMSKNVGVCMNIFFVNVQCPMQLVGFESVLRFSSIHVFHLVPAGLFHVFECRVVVERVFHRNVGLRNAKGTLLQLVALHRATSFLTL